MKSGVPTRTRGGRKLYPPTGKALAFVSRIFTLHSIHVLCALVYGIFLILGPRSSHFEARMGLYFCACLAIKLAFEMHLPGTVEKFE